MHAAIEALEVVEFDGSSVSLRIIDTKQAGYARMSKARIESVIEEVAGRTVRISFVEDAKPEASTRQTNRPASVDPVAQSQAMKDPVVRRAMELFDARIVDIRDEPDAPDAQE